MSKKSRIYQKRFLAGVPLREAVEEDFYYYTIEEQYTYKHFNTRNFPFFYLVEDRLQFSFTRPYTKTELEQMKKWIKQKLMKNQLFVVDSYLPGEDSEPLPTFKSAVFK